MIDVTEHDKGVSFDFTTSGGPGGQHANKTETKAVLYFDISKSEKLTDEQKRTLLCEDCSTGDNQSLQTLQNRLSGAGKVIISNAETKSREQNKNNALETLNELLNDALKPKKKRITKPTKRAKAAKRKAIQKKKVAKYKRKKAGLE